ncbi:hypothetical protein PPERSA_10943 [Pseudocohnilembus persalinus]|uniref:Uncharacterized protein n=1 Tax=Pseudocohnilembus persalinus TaxID=266149 RepID=A0A0V0QCB0_PSEPJ|nr:hypothetical protein PPERSA_10943 [Pseudocohnilembus persalinus]|eukprot:KRW99824.1 hypothetical protein PPERSA_10943 [Pseudocohnilembus persalinus]
MKNQSDKSSQNLKLYSQNDYLTTEATQNKNNVDLSYYPNKKQSFFGKSSDIQQTMSTSRFRKTKLVHKPIDLNQLKIKTEYEIDQVDQQIDKFLKSIDNMQVFSPEINKIRAHCLQVSKYNRLNRNIQEKYSDYISIGALKQQEKQKIHEKEVNMLGYLQNVISHPKVQGEENNFLQQQQQMNNKNNNNYDEQHQKQSLQNEQNNYNSPRQIEQYMNRIRYMKSKAVNPIHLNTKIDKYTQEKQFNINLPIKYS